MPAITIRADQDSDCHIIEWNIWWGVVLLVTLNILIFYAVSYHRLRRSKNGQDVENPATENGPAGAATNDTQVQRPPSQRPSGTGHRRSHGELDSHQVYEAEAHVPEVLTGRSPSTFGFDPRSHAPAPPQRSLTHRSIRTPTSRVGGRALDTSQFRSLDTSEFEQDVESAQGPSGHHAPASSRPSFARRGIPVSISPVSEAPTSSSGAAREESGNEFEESSEGHAAAGRSEPQDEETGREVSNGHGHHQETSRPRQNSGGNPAASANSTWSSVDI